MLSSGPSENRLVMMMPSRHLVSAGFTELAPTSFPTDWLRPRMWALGHNLRAYAATYVALTEMIDATALLTHRRPAGQCVRAAVPPRIVGLTCTYARNTQTDRAWTVASVPAVCSCVEAWGGASNMMFRELSSTERR